MRFAGQRQLARSGTRFQGDRPVDTLVFYLGQAVPALFVLLLLLISCLGLGLPLSRRLDLLGHGAALDMSFAATLGIGLLSTYGVLLGLIGGFQTDVLRMALVLPVAAGTWLALPFLKRTIVPSIGACSGAAPSALVSWSYSPVSSSCWR